MSNARELTIADFIAHSEEMKKALKTARMISSRSFPVLIEGEPGVGKTALASAIHRSGDRVTRELAVVDCAALPESLLEHALFGFAPGSVTPGAQSPVGYVEIADGGTLIIDEVSAISQRTQFKLLQFLLGGTFSRIGSKTPLSSNVRVLATTTKDLRDSVATGEFREDLYYKLSMITISVPPLRRRAQDILALANAFLRMSAAESKRDIQGFDAAALEALANYSWPGNVRQLKTEIQRAVLMCDSDRITLTDLGLSSPSPSSNTAQLPSTNRINFFE